MAAQALRFLRRMIPALTVGLAMYAAVATVLFLTQRSLMYFPSTVMPSAAGSGMASVAYETADGLTLQAWHAPAAAGRPTIVLFHGNAGHHGDRVWKVRFLRDAGYGVLLASYRGYGGNPGRPTEAGLTADGHAAMAWLNANGVPPERTVLYGESLGSGVACILASRYDVAAVILEAPFTSIADVARTRFPIFPVGLLVRDRFDNLSRVAGLQAPLLILHGERDATVPVRFGRRLYDAAGDPKRGAWFAQAEHTDLYEHGAADAVLEFLASLPSADVALETRD